MSDTTALAKRNESEIAELHNDVAEIKKENQAILEDLIIVALHIIVELAYWFTENKAI